MTAGCDLCGVEAPELVLRSPRLDGPLVRCRGCGLHYVAPRGTDFTFRAADEARSAALAGRVAELDLVRHDVEDAERPQRVQADVERLERLRRHVAHGRLLDVGCATGIFLGVARETFAGVGVEPDPGTSEQARAAGVAVSAGTVDDVPRPPGGFDVVTMFHTIEHLDSPCHTLDRVRELLAPGGIVMIETPTLDCIWFRLSPRHWRQLIPDHYYFYSRRTLEQLLRRCGLEPIEYTKVARSVSLRFLADRLRRSGVPWGGRLAGLLRGRWAEQRTVRINPGDIMSVVARRPPSPAGAPASLRPRPRSPARHRRRR